MQWFFSVIIFTSIIIDTIVSEYENTWNFYYEQPCCNLLIGQHHVRHHRGNYYLYNLFE